MFHDLVSKISTEIRHTVLHKNLVCVRMICERSDSETRSSSLPLVAQISHDTHFQSECLKLM